MTKDSDSHDTHSDDDDKPRDTSPVVIIGPKKFDLTQGADEAAGIAQGKLIRAALPPEYQEKITKFADFIVKFQTTVNDIPEELRDPGLLARVWKDLKAHNPLDDKETQLLESPVGTWIKSTDIYRTYHRISKGTTFVGNVVDIGADAALALPRFIDTLFMWKHESDNAANHFKPITREQAEAIATAYEASMYKNISAPNAPDAPPAPGFFDHLGANFDHWMSWVLHFIADKLHMPGFAAVLMAVPTWVTNGFDWDKAYADSHRTLAAEHGAVSADAILKNIVTAPNIPAAHDDAVQGTLDAVDTYAGVSIKPIVNALTGPTFVETVPLDKNGHPDPKGHRVFIQTPGGGKLPDPDNYVPGPNKTPLTADQYHDHDLKDDFGVLLSNLGWNWQTALGGALVVHLGSRIALTPIKGAVNITVGALSGALRGRANALYNLDRVERLADAARDTAERGAALRERVLDAKKKLSRGQFRELVRGLNDPEARARIEKAGQDKYDATKKEQIALLEKGRDPAQLRADKAQSARLRAAADAVEAFGQRRRGNLEYVSLPLPFEHKFRRWETEPGERLFFWKHWKERTAQPNSPNESVFGGISHGLVRRASHGVNAVDRRARDVDHAINQAGRDTIADRNVRRLERRAHAIRNGEGPEFKQLLRLEDQYSELAQQRDALRARQAKLSPAAGRKLDSRIKTLEFQMEGPDHKSGLVGKIEVAEKALKAQLAAHPVSAEMLAHARQLELRARNLHIAKSEGWFSLGRAIAHPNEHVSLHRMQRALPPLVGGVPPNVVPHITPPSSPPPAIQEGFLARLRDWGARNVVAPVKNLAAGNWFGSRAPAAHPVGSGVPTHSKTPIFYQHPDGTMEPATVHGPAATAKPTFSWSIQRLIPGSPENQARAVLKAQGDLLRAVAAKDGPKIDKAYKALVKAGTGLEMIDGQRTTEDWAKKAADVVVHAGGNVPKGDAKALADALSLSRESLLRDVSKKLQTAADRVLPDVEGHDAKMNDAMRRMDENFRRAEEGGGKKAGLLGAVVALLGIGVATTAYAKPRENDAVQNPLAKALEALVKYQDPAVQKQSQEIIARIIAAAPLKDGQPQIDAGKAVAQLLKDIAEAKDPKVIAADKAAIAALNAWYKDDKKAIGLDATQAKAYIEKINADVAPVPNQPAQPPASPSQLAAVQANLATPIRSDVAAAVALPNPQAPLGHIDPLMALAAHTGAQANAAFLRAGSGKIVIAAVMSNSLCTLAPSDTNGATPQKMDPAAYCSAN